MTLQKEACTQSFVPKSDLNTYLIFRPANLLSKKMKRFSSSCCEYNVFFVYLSMEWEHPNPSVNACGPVGAHLKAQWGTTCKLCMEANFTVVIR